MVEPTLFQIVHPIIRRWPVYRQLVVWIYLAGYVQTDANSLIGYLVSPAHCDSICADERVGG
jgi:hypothetical protein